MFNPIRQELTAIFKGLTIKKKYGKGRGKPVIGYQFTFKPEIKKADDFNKHAPTKEDQNKALALADKQKEYEEPATTINEKIKQKKREVEPVSYTHLKLPTTLQQKYSFKHSLSTTTSMINIVHIL